MTLSKSWGPRCGLAVFWLCSFHTDSLCPTVWSRTCAFGLTPKIFHVKYFRGIPCRRRHQQKVSVWANRVWPACQISVISHEAATRSPLVRCTWLINPLLSNKSSKRSNERCKGGASLLWFSLQLKQTMATRVRELTDGHPHSDNIDTDVNFGIRSILAWPDRLFVVAFITMLLFIVFFGLIFHIVF